MQINRLATFVALLAALFGRPARAASFDLVYGGRMVQANGAPITGTFDVSVRFFDQATGNGRLIASDLVVPGVIVDASGTFTLAIPLAGADRDAVFGAAGEVWIELQSA